MYDRRPVFLDNNIPYFKKPFNVHKLYDVLLKFIKEKKQLLPFIIRIVNAKTLSVFLIFYGNNYFTLNAGRVLMSIAEKNRRMNIFTKQICIQDIY